MEKEQWSPGAFYGANVEGPLQRIPRVSGARFGSPPRRMEPTMNIPKARQIPVEGAVTGPEAPPARVDAIRGRVGLDDLDEMAT